jgi:hypothetical protein
MLKFVSLPLTILFVLVGTFLLYDFMNHPALKPSALVFETPAGEVSVKVDVALSGEEQARGLSGRESLGADEGLLFVFKASGFLAFWMKDMRFPIDIIWIDENLKVVDVTRNLATSTYPDSVMSSVAAKYVLEVNAGWTQKNGVTSGTPARLN